jgi:hypothetical protein
MSDLDSTMSSLLGSAATSAFAKGGNNRQGSSVDRALGAAASLGLSLAILRLVVQAYKAVKSQSLENNEGQPAVENISRGSTLSAAFFGYMRRVLRRILIDDGHDSNIDNYNDGAMITHQGSCHCESVCFEAVAPRCLATQDGPGKIQFRRTEIKANKFRVVKGKECLNTYYVYCERTSRRGAHAFCGRCGVHILYAPCKNSPTLYLNVDCMTEGIRKLRSTDTPATISDGAAVEGQWDDQLSTISEVSAESESTFLKRLYSQESAMSIDTNDWTTYSLYDANDALKTPGASDQAYPVTPSTPSTVDSFTATDSQVSSLRMTTTDQDSLATESDSTISLNAPPKPAMERTPLPASQPRLAFASPQIRDQMKYFMRKHLATPPSEIQSRDEEKKSNQ